METQAWFWSPEWQAKEREVDEELAAGHGTDFASAAALLEHLDQLADDHPTSDSPAP